MMDVTTETVHDNIHAAILPKAQKVAARPALGSIAWHDTYHAAADYLKAFGIEPTDKQVDRITEKVKRPHLWKQALHLWKVNGGDRCKRSHTQLLAAQRGKQGHD